MKRLAVTLMMLSTLIFLQSCEHKLPSPQNPMVEPPPSSTEMALEDFHEPEACAGCHPNHYNEWKGAMHAYAVIDPVFNAMQDLGQQETQGKMDQFCIQCHSPIASKLGLTPAFYKKEDLPPIGRRGVSCMVCHTIYEVNQPANADVELAPRMGIRGPIEDPVDNSFHVSVHEPMLKTSELCSGCHNVVNPRGVTIENTFNEWKNSPAAAEGQQCQDCHMPAYQGQAAVGGPQRQVHRHTFVGVDIALVDFPNRDQQLQMVTQLLQSAATIDAEAPDSISAGSVLPLKVNITSKTAGHFLPSGAVADRQMWVAITVTDKATGRLLYQSGQLDPNGDLMDRHSDLYPNADYDLVEFSQLMVGENGNDVFFSWQAYGERTQTLPPLATVSPIYSIVVPQEVSGPLQIDLRLRFRSFAPFILRKLNLGDLVEKVPIIDMATWSAEIAVK